MIITNKQEMNRQTAIRTAKLLRLEAPFARDIRRYLRQLSSDYATMYAVSGRRLNVSRFNNELAGILKTHYRKVAKAFRGDATLDAKMFGLKYEKKQSVQQEIDAEIAQYIVEQSERQARTINETNQAQLDKTLSDQIIAGVAVATAAGSIESDALQEEVAEETRKEFNKRVNGKSDTISATEAGMMQSFTFDTEAVFLWGAAAIAGEAVSQQLVKRWDAILDSKTRDAHVGADGIVTEMGGSFPVGPDTLRYPRDPSGSPGNIINCMTGDMVVEFADPELLTRRYYSGDVYEIMLSNFQTLKLTPNHPVLTDSGFKMARLITQHDRVLCVARDLRKAVSDKDISMEIEKKYESLRILPVVKRSYECKFGFHGENVDGMIDMIRVPGILKSRVRPFFNKTIHDGMLSKAPMSGGAYFGWLLLNPFFRFIRTLLKPALALRTLYKSMRGIELNDREKQFKAFLSFGSFLYVDVLYANKKKYDGYVYNIESKNGFYSCNGAIIHNCRCQEYIVPRDASF